MTVIPEVAKSHLEEEEPLLSGVTAPSSGGIDEPRTCCHKVLQAGKGEQGKWLCQKTKILLYTQGKRRRCQLRRTTKPSGHPSPAASLRQTIPPVLNSTALGEQVGLELSGRQQMWSEPSRWKGRIKKCTTRHSWRWVESQAKQMAWADWATKADQEKRQQETQQTSKTK